ncbi:MAG TPA: DUF1007 family protein [Pseudolabrys sp.]|nr:DUF1007 family protein [Pseudolabrys sp.]
MRLPPIRRTPWYVADSMAIFLRILFAALLALVVVTRADAHPHVWVTMKTELVYAPDGTITGVQHSWAFDDMFSVFATQGLESKTKGVFTREELAPLAKVNVDSLKEYGYFTYVTADGKKAELTDPQDGKYWLDYNDSILTLHFTLPFKQPLKAKDLLIDIYDPTIFVDFEFAKDRPVSAANLPAQCKMTFERPREMTFAEGKALSNIPADQPNLTMQWGAQFANKIKVKCG